MCILGPKCATFSRVLRRVAVMLVGFVSHRRTVGAVVLHSVYRPGDGLDDRGNVVRFQAEARDSPSAHIAQTSFGALLPIKWVVGAFSLPVKRPGREADHPPPSSAEVKNECWSTPPCAFMPCIGAISGISFFFFFAVRTDNPSMSVVMPYSL